MIVIIGQAQRSPADQETDVSSEQSRPIAEGSQTSTWARRNGICNGLKEKLECSPGTGDAELLKFE